MLGDDDLATFNSHVEISELTARFGGVERALASIETRLSQLETRPQTPAPAPVQSGAAVAKAAGKKRPQQPQTREQIAADLMRRIDAYIDSPTATGQLSSMVEAGEFDKVRAAVERAEVAHETEKIRQERKTWT